MGIQSNTALPPPEQRVFTPTNTDNPMSGPSTPPSFTQVAPPLSQGAKGGQPPSPQRLGQALQNIGNNPSNIMHAIVKSRNDAFGSQKNATPVMNRGNKGKAPPPPEQRVFTPTNSSNPLSPP